MYKSGSRALKDFARRPGAPVPPELQDEEAMAQADLAALEKATFNASSEEDQSDGETSFGLSSFSLLQPDAAPVWL